MAKHRHKHPVAAAALLGAAVLAGVAGPVHASPADAPGGQVPDAGARPVPSGALALPGAATAPANTPLSALAQQITAAETEVQRIGERLKQLSLDRAAARTRFALADRDWRAAAERLKQAEQDASATAARAFKAAAGLPPGLDSELRQLGALSAPPGDDIPGTGAARDLLNAQQDERARFQVYSEAIKAEQTLASQYLATQATLKQREQALLEFRQRNASQLAAIEREREAREQSLGAQYIGNGAVDGYGAHPKALAAVRKALEQVGDPYVWAAEGPDAFDCSGLSWYAYFYGAGYNLPRVSRDQYNGTRNRSVSRYSLLPGDLVFFASDPNDWTSISHLGVYIGGGKMVQAPSTGDVVKVSTVWWSRFFAATRVFDAVAGAPTVTAPNPPASGGSPPNSGATPAPTPSKAPPPSPSPTRTAPPSTPPTSKPPSSPPPSRPPSPSPPPSTGSTGESPTPSPSDSG